MSDLSQSGCDLPEELRFYIFEFLLEHSQASSTVHLLRVSRRVYQWALPKFYHSVKITSVDDALLHSVKPTRLIEHARLESLLLIEELQCGTLNTPFPFTPFKNLKRLALWGPSLFDSDQIRSLLYLSLDELYISDAGDHCALRDCKWIHGTPLQKSLRKITTRYYSGTKMINSFPYLTHILSGSTVDNLGPHAADILPLLLERKSIECWAFYPGWYINWQSVLGPVGYPNDLTPWPERDHRLVCIKHRLSYLHPHTTDPDIDFWEEQGHMWRNAEKAVAENYRFKIIMLGAF
ncbi:hypothetical protein DL96DRAFT_1821527 [Flagelloscypha sp. PMI_526]|nr:hypothetical protein DL96DRAFT_1821527 [Flagelloscypha sp. PMI_526]